jgi:hypothetical protein
MKGLKYVWLLIVALMTTGLVSACSDDDNNGSQSSPIKVSKIYLEDYQSSVPDREVDFARLGQLIRIEGEGFLGLKKLYVNGYDTYFNVAYVTDKSMLVTLSDKTPVVDAEEDVRNTLRFVKDQTETTYAFTIRAASPSISSISNTLPQAGERVYVYGANLHETTKVTLPGGVEVTDITSDTAGKWYSFAMPSGVTEAGSITSEGANGTAVTPEYFNNRNCIILDFDGNGDQGFWSWSENGSMINDEDLADDPLNSGRGKCCQIIPDRLLEAGGVLASKSRATECWTGGNDSDLDDWTRMTKYIPADTPLTEVAFQFDVYIPEGWGTSGQIQICLINNYNFGGYGSDDSKYNGAVAFYIPWIVNGEATTYKNSGWETVTIPFSEFFKYKADIEDATTTDPTFQTVIDDRNSAKYRNFGMGFVNTDFTYDGVEISSVVASPKIYIDNWRIVPCASFTVSDFDDEEAE